MEWALYFALAMMLLMGTGHYLGVYYVLARQSQKARPNERAFWAQLPLIVLLFLLSLCGASLFILFTPLQSLGIFGIIGAGTAILHVFVWLMLCAPEQNRTTVVPRYLSARYTCRNCCAPVPDRMLECPCCFERVPLTERAEELLPLPAAPLLPTVEQLPCPISGLNESSNAVVQLCLAQTENGRFSEEKQPS